MIRVKVLKECSVLLLGSKKECRVQLIRVKVLKVCSVQLIREKVQKECRIQFTRVKV